MPVLLNILVILMFLFSFIGILAREIEGILMLKQEQIKPLYKVRHNAIPDYMGFIHCDNGGFYILEYREYGLSFWRKSEYFETLQKALEWIRRNYGVERLRVDKYPLE